MKEILVGKIQGLPRQVSPPFLLTISVSAGYCQRALLGVRDDLNTDGEAQQIITGLGVWDALCDTTPLNPTVIFSCFFGHCSDKADMCLPCNQCYCLTVCALCCVSVWQQYAGSKTF